jgi:predicted GH43/DUF377 family glycosyl hydrolase
MELITKCVNRIQRDCLWRPWVVLFLVFISPLQASLDLEENVQDFVLETIQIKIPGYKFAYNPSITRFEGSLLLSFRDTPNAKSRFESQIGVVWLDDNFTPITPPQILDVRKGSPIPSRAEDARLINVGDRLYMVYDDNRDAIITKGGYRVCMTELHYNGESFCLQNTECLKTFEGESSQKREKSWVPFNFQGQLLLAYSLDPHLIFKPILGTESCETFAMSKTTPSWNWGELRGGTPALIVEDKYLAFFHSSKVMASVQSNGEPMLHYFIGAYTFMSEPPFSISQISPVPIIAKGFYSGKSYEYYWKPIRAVFPCGYIHDENYIWIAYGRHDHEIWIVKLDKKKLLNSLKPIANL